MGFARGLCTFARGHAHGWILRSTRLRLCAGARARLDFAFDLSAPLRGGFPVSSFPVRLCAGVCPFGRIFWCFCPFAQERPRAKKFSKWQKREVRYIVLNIESLTLATLPCEAFHPRVFAGGPSSTARASSLA